jgi:hypothetical protein
MRLRALLIALTLVLTGDTSHACDSLGDARKSHPSAHLYRHGKCWYAPASAARRKAGRNGSPPVVHGSRQGVAGRNAPLSGDPSLLTSYWPDMSTPEFIGWLRETAKADLGRAYAASPDLRKAMAKLDLADRLMRRALYGTK